MSRPPFRHPLALDLREFIEDRPSTFINVVRLIAHCRRCSSCRRKLWRLCDTDDERERVFGIIDAGGR